MLGAAHAGVTVVWALGGSLGLDQLGGTLADMVRSAGPRETVLLWLVAAVKLAPALPGVLLLAGPRILRAPATVAAYTAGGLLAAYGGLLVLGQALVVSGVIDAAPDADLTAIRAHLVLWDPWFLAWGACLLLAAALRPAKEAGRAATAARGAPSASQT